LNASSAFKVTIYLLHISCAWLNNDEKLSLSDAYPGMFLVEHIKILTLD